MNQSKHHSIRIGERLYKRITKHIQFLKHLYKAQSNQNWIENAILKKIKKEDEQGIIECCPPERHLNFVITPQINARIEKSVEVIKNIRSSFSKKQWILEALHEQLDLEEQETETQAKQLLDKMVKEIHESSKNSSP